MNLIDSCVVCSRVLWKPGLLCFDCRRDLSAGALVQRDVRGLLVLSLVHYVPPASNLVKLCKRQDMYTLAFELGAIVAKKFIIRTTLDFKTVIPMPAKTLGGHDHAYFVALGAASVFGGSVDLSRIKRGADLPAQKEQDEVGRTLSKIHLRRADGPAVAGPVLLVDDVVTTGETLCQAWNALNCPEVVGLTLASTPRYFGGGR